MKEAWVINLEERPERLAQFRTNKFPFEVSRLEAIPHEQGWVGCAQSHIEVLERIKTLPAIVFEDDAELVRPWSVVDEAMKELPDNWDLLHLGVHGKRATEPFSKHLLRLRHGYCCHAIVYGSWEVVNTIINGWDNYVENINKRTRAAIDGFYYDVIHPMFNCFVIHPPVAEQRPGYSDIEHKHRRFRDYRKWI